MGASIIKKIKRPTEFQGFYYKKLFYVLSHFIIFLFIFSFSILLNNCVPKTTIETQVSTAVPPEIDATSAEGLKSDGIRYYHKGDFVQAISKFEGAELQFAKDNNYRKRVETIILIAQTYQSIGQYEKSLGSAEIASALSESSGDQYFKVKALNLIGTAYLGLGQMNKAQQYLEKSLQTSQRYDSPKLTASILNNLGNLYTTQKEYEKALSFYLECVSNLEIENDLELIGIALTNAATAAMRNEQYERSKSLLDQAVDSTRNFPNSRSKAYALINIGLTYQALILNLPDSKDLLLRESSEIYNLAADVAEKIGDNLALSYASGYLGSLSENEGQLNEAMNLTRLAIFKAQEVNAPEAIFRWQWQAGRIFKAMSNIDEAISLYRGCIATLSSIVHEKTGCYGPSDSTINESTEKVSFELVDLLLKRASLFENPSDFEPYLVEARKVLELQKVYELRNYYRDDCVDAARSGLTQLDEISKTAVIIYPIVLQDRLEVLYTLPGSLNRFSVNVGREELSQEVGRFRRMLEKRTTREYLPHAQKLYDWLIRPMEANLTSVKVDTLVFIPDGSLRTIPMAALHNGKRFLVEEYAIAVTPGMELTDPRPLGEKSSQVLLLAITQSALGFPPLPYVASEIQGIQAIFKSKLLLNEEFLTYKMESALKDQKYTILHIASHAQFGGNVENAFIVAYDDKLSISSLDQYIGLLQFRDQPLELLTLSACETSSGNEQAALGLAGIAIKAGARSALASLWHVNDFATSILIDEFYSRLHEPSSTRAKSLQKSQLKLLNDQRFQHPCYWSPFLIINNWL